ncbi:hypothetical protein KAU09_00125 [Candidatus Parcubacteria bacterium]|nr:hypothetical protein [Candidatus Parcubacteria bacterium]
MFIEKKELNSGEGPCGRTKRIFEVEICNMCHLKCKICLREKLSEHGKMGLDMFDKILKFLKGTNYEEVFFSGRGDVFLHQDIFSFIDLLYKKMPKIKLVIPTKGQSIKPEHIEYFKKIKKDRKNLTICFSIFSLKKTRMESWTGIDCSNFFEIMNQVDKNGIDYVFDFTIFEDNMDEWENFIKFAKKKNKDYDFSVAHNWNGKMPKDVHKKFVSAKLEKYLRKRNPKTKCEVFLDDYLFFDFKGNISLCSIDMNSQNIFGHVSKSKYYEIMKKKRKINYHENCKECLNYKYVNFVYNVK